MTTLYEDPSLGFGNEGDLTMRPSSAGVGLAAPGADPLRSAVDQIDAQAQAPTGLPAARPSVRDSMGDLNMFQKLGLTLQEAGAGVRGGPSPIDAFQKQRREEGALKVRELKEHVDALESGNKIARTLQGDAKSNFVKDYSAQLNEMRPGLGDTFAHVAEQPDILEKFQSYMPYLPESMKLMAKNNPDGFWKMLSSPEGMKEVERAKGMYYQNFATKKTQTMMMGLDHLGLPEDMVAQAKKDGMTASLFTKMQDALPKDSPVRLSEEERAAVRQDGKMFFESLGIMTPQTEQDVIKKRAEDKGNVVEVGVAGGLMQKARVKEDGTTILIGEPYKKKDGTTITLGAPVAGVDEDGKPVFFQPSKQGGDPSIVPGVRPAPKEKKPNILTDLLNQAGGGGKPSAKPNATATGVRAKFAADPDMKGNTLGAETPKGFEVKDKAGKVIGHYN